MCLIRSLRLFWADSENYGKIWRDSQIWMGIGLRREELAGWGKLDFWTEWKVSYCLTVPRAFVFLPDVESKFMSESDTTLLTWEMCRNLNLFIGLRCLNDPDFSWPRVRPKIGSSQECETRTWSVRYQSCLRLNNLNIPSDFIQHLLHRYVVELKAHNT